MNTKKRTALRSAASLLERANDIISSVKDQEEDSLENMPENLQESDRCVEMESTIDDLGNIISQIEDVEDSLDNVIGG